MPSESGFEPTYKELKRDTFIPNIERNKSFEPTYKELKQFTKGYLFGYPLSFEPTYKELKLWSLYLYFSCVGAFWAYL